MDHHEATRRGAVEKYLLDEIAPPERDEFEEHFFDCQECAADLRTTAAFLDAATQELKRFIPDVPAPKPARKSPFAFLWRPAFAAPGLALLLLVIAYQNVVVYPRLTGGRTGQSSGSSALGLSDRRQQPRRPGSLGNNQARPAHPAVRRHSGGRAILELRLHIGCAVRRQCLAGARLGRTSQRYRLDPDPRRHLG